MTHFWYKIWAFLFFRKILQIDIFKGADLKHDNTFKFWPKNTQVTHFISNLCVFVFTRVFDKFDKFEGADLKYRNSFFKILAQRYSSNAFLIPHLGIFFFFFCKILQLDKSEGANFKYDKFFLKFYPKIPRYNMLRPKFRHFCFFAKFCN